MDYSFDNWFNNRKWTNMFYKQPINHRQWIIPWEKWTSDTWLLYNSSCIKVLKTKDQVHIDHRQWTTMLIVNPNCSVASGSALTHCQLATKVNIKTNSVFEPQIDHRRWIALHLSENRQWTVVLFIQPVESEIEWISRLLLMTDQGHW